MTSGQLTPEELTDLDLVTDLLDELDTRRTPPSS